MRLTHQTILGFLLVFVLLLLALAVTSGSIATWEWLTKDAGSFFTAILAGLTAILAFVSVAQIKYLRRADETARRAADAALTSATVARDALTKAQRAFVFPDNVESSSHIDPASGTVWWRFHVVWRNSGQTPTRNLRIWVQKYEDESRMPKGFKFKPTEGRLIPALIGPSSKINGDAIVITGESLAKSQFDDATFASPSGSVHAYIWGWAKYNDVFDGTPEHETRFCFKIKCLGNMTKMVDAANPVNFIYALHPRHNGADEDCKQEDASTAPRKTI